MKRYLVYVLAALLVLALLPAVALAETTKEVGTAEDLATTIQSAQSGDIIKLTANITLEGPGLLGSNNSTYYAITKEGITIDGQGHTIKIENPGVETGAYEGPILIGFNGSGAAGTVKNLNIVVTQKGVKHAIQAYKGASLTVQNVNVSGCLGYALVVNSAEVTVNGLTTSGNGSGGINVDNGADILDKTPSLTVNNATIEDENSVYVENKVPNSKAPEVTIVEGSFQEVKVNKDQSIAKTCLSVSGGEFATPPTDYVEEGKTAARLGGTTYVGSPTAVANKLKSATSGQIITVLTGNLELNNVAYGVTVENQGGGNVTVNDKQVPQGGRTSVTKPIAGVVIGGGNQQEDEDEPEQSPSNTLRYAVICRTLNVRSGPGTEYSKLGTLSRGTLLDGELLSNGWVKFSYNGQTAYVSGMYVQSVDNGQLSVQCGTLNVRSGAGTSYSKIGALYRGTYVKPLETQGNWYKIGYDGGYGWICADYVG